MESRQHEIHYYDYKLYVGHDNLQVRAWVTLYGLAIFNEIILKECCFLSILIYTQQIIIRRIEPIFSHSCFIFSSIVKKFIKELSWNAITKIDSIELQKKELPFWSSSMILIVLWIYFFTKRIEVNLLFSKILTVYNPDCKSSTEIEETLALNLPDRTNAPVWL